MTFGSAHNQSQPKTMKTKFWPSKLLKFQNVNCNMKYRVCQRQDNVKLISKRQSISDTNAQLGRMSTIIRLQLLVPLFTGSIQSF